MCVSVWVLKVAAMCVHLFTHIRTQHKQAGKNILAFNVTNCVHLFSWKWNSPSSPPSFTLFIPSLAILSLYVSPSFSLPRSSLLFKVINFAVQRHLSNDNWQKSCDMLLLCLHCFPPPSPTLSLCLNNLVMPCSVWL